jgi:hypothetical protein
VLTQTVGKAATSNALTVSQNPTTVNDSVTFTATVTGAFGGSPSGTVSFQNGTTVLGSGKVNASTHQATLTTRFSNTGTYSIQAVYGGDVHFNASTSPVGKLVVNLLAVSSMNRARRAAASGPPGLCSDLSTRADENEQKHAPDSFAELLDAQSRCREIVFAGEDSILAGCLGSIQEFIGGID